MPGGRRVEHDEVIAPRGPGRQRCARPSSHAFVIVTSSRAPGAAATKPENAFERTASSTSARGRTSCPAHSASAPSGSAVVGHRSGATGSSVPGTRPQVDPSSPGTRRCPATSQTIVRRPACAPSSAIAAATVVLPTPPLPVTTTRRRDRGGGVVEPSAMPSTVEGRGVRHPNSSATPIAPVVACSCATTRRTSSRRGACRASGARRCTRCTATCAAPTRSPTTDAQR